ncbi:MAG: general secretion pathway protein G [Porticoccaceae bacterium]|jgi:general secretion pathway protein G
MIRNVKLTVRKTNERRNAFTLIEVLLVLAIIGAIMSMVVPKLLGRQKHANADATRISVRGVEQALKLYALDHGGDYPPVSDGLKSLVQSPNARDNRWRGPYLEKPPTDAWGSTLEYLFPGRNNPGGFDVVSPGPDRVSGTDDDIGNWDA